MGWSRFFIPLFPAVGARVVLVGLAVVLALLLLPASVWASGGDSYQRFDLPKDPDTVLKEILSREEFRERPKSIMERLSERLNRLLERLLDWIAARFPRMKPITPDPHTAWFVLGCLMIGAAAILAFAIATLVIKVLQERRPRPPAYDEDLPTAQGLAFSGSMLHEAIKRGESGDYQGAVVLLFRHVLMRLDELGKLPYHPGRTNGEILRSVSGNEPIRTALTQMIPFFNRVRYGNQPCERMDYERFRSQCQELTERAVQP